MLATAWLTFYNIAMTAGYVRPEGPSSRRRPLAFRAPGAGGPGGAPGGGVVAARGRRAARWPWGRGVAAAAGLEWSVVGGARGAGALLAGHCLIRCTACAAAAGRGPEVKYRPGQECGAAPPGRRLRPGRRGRRCCCSWRNAGVPPPRSPEPSGRGPRPASSAAGPWSASSCRRWLGRVFLTVHVATGFFAVVLFCFLSNSAPESFLLGTVF